ncbi:PTS transporter subunit EIIB [Rodentibacter trehalosifermentans]|uniref:PTS EIIB type-1 domain-containing protein n=1 Tax=Rodentibacter trehalosifermentans TaxID=1908263 RepID=A0A1V3ING0_9PAST|nr:PTS transporter subunit EIIB [Rodentibacter trehalosifermentans]OOF43607.1 hypothetical protein BKK51_11315 [Rodentibacter trehalosifermentans]OOF44444.1 hypothetical protein BKK52_13095 [Rodentibacter trehalosifermentans]OOF51380.1 hypothetical protein BKK53_07510 [Rodentibacter trehalosifermentans]
MDYSAIAYELIEKLGGRNNISALTHCATRIRVVLNNDSKIDKLAIEKMPCIKGLFSLPNQYQIIVGSEIVKELHDAMSHQLLS